MDEFFNNNEPGYTRNGMTPYTTKEAVNALNIAKAKPSIRAILNKPLHKNGLLVPPPIQIETKTVFKNRHLILPTTPLTAREGSVPPYWDPNNGVPPSKVGPNAKAPPRNSTISAYSNAPPLDKNIQLKPSKQQERIGGGKRRTKHRNTKSRKRCPTKSRKLRR